MNVVLRRAGSDIYPLVYGSWISCVVGQRGFTAGQPRDCARESLRARIERVLASPSTIIATAHDRDGSTDISLGFVVIRNRFDIVYFIYVKMPFRRLGIGTSMMRWIAGNADGRITFATWTKAMRFMAPRWDVDADEGIMHSPESF